jgi:hypothetical protein
MKCTYENGVYRIEPHTDREADAIKGMVDAYSAKAFTPEGSHSTIQLQPSARSHRKASAE